ALAGFFIGTGRMQVVTRTMVASNIINIILNYILVFRFDMGCTGSAIATGLSQFCQTVYYLTLFLNHNSRTVYGTGDWGFDKVQFIEFLRLAVPSSIGRMIEVTAHVVFFRIMVMAGTEAMTIATMVQSFFLLCNFMVDGLAKGATAIISNCVGAGKKELLSKVLKAAMSVHTIVFFVVMAFFMVFTEQAGSIFFSESERAMMSQPGFVSTLRLAMFWMTIFFLFDGFGWIFFGLFTACNDTKFV